MNEAAVRFENVTKHFTIGKNFAGGIKVFLFHFVTSLKQIRKDRFVTLMDLSFEVARGESVGIIGRNGAGKSTTLALIAGVLKPNQGNVVVRGRVFPLLELGAGFHPDLSGRENMLLNGVLMGLRRREVVAKLDEIAEFSELGDFIHQPVRTYSSGMLARLGFSVVAHLDPEILLVDEVLAVGDASFQKKCLEKMNEFRRRGVTMVFVSHDMHSIQQVCDRAIWIDQHRLRMQGEPGAVVQAYLSDLGQHGGN